MPQFASLYSLPGSTPIAELLYRGGPWRNAVLGNEAGEVIALHIVEGYAAWLPMIEACTALQVLVWENCPLKTWQIPASLQHLRWLDLSESKTLQNLSFAAPMPALERIEAHHCPELRSVVVPAGCAELHTVDVSQNPKLTTFTIGNDCVNLFHVDASYTAVKEFRVPSGCEQLALLYLHNGALDTLVFDAISPPKGLRTLHLAKTQLQALPDLGELGVLENLNIKGTQLNGIPPEILEKPTEELLATIRDFQNKLIVKRELREAKIVLVGNGTVGKTSLIHRLLYNSFNESEAKTEGIQIYDTAVDERVERIVPSRRNWWQKLLHLPAIASPIAEDVRIALHFWDFGGQEIMHATHRFFITKRSVYLVVVNPREEDKQELPHEINTIEYWVRLIQSYADKNVPIIVVINKCEGHTADLGKGTIKDKFPQIIDFIETDCKSGKGISELNAKIVKTISKLDHVKDKLPETYFLIKKELIQMEKDYISYSAYKSLCHKIIFTDFDDVRIKSLISLLHDLGIMLNFREHTNDIDATQVLKPEWVTKGVYAVATNTEVIKSGGIISFNDVSNILRNHPSKKYVEPKEWQFIVDTMCNFGLAYRMPGSPPNGDNILLPGAFPKDRPKGFFWNAEKSLRFQYQYAILPSAVMAQFIYHSHTNLKPRQYWRNGAVLSIFDCEAFIESDSSQGVIKISIIGKGDKSQALGYVRGVFDSIHAQLGELGMQELVLVVGSNPNGTQVEALYPLGKLHKAAQDNMNEFYIPEIGTINVADALGIYQLSQKDKQDIITQHHHNYNAPHASPNFGTSIQEMHNHADQINIIDKAKNATFSTISSSETYVNAVDRFLKNLQKEGLLNISEAERQALVNEVKIEVDNSKITDLPTLKDRIQNRLVTMFQKIAASPEAQNISFGLITNGIYDVLKAVLHL